MFVICLEMRPKYSKTTHDGLLSSHVDCSISDGITQIGTGENGSSTGGLCD